MYFTLRRLHPFWNVSFFCISWYPVRFIVRVLFLSIGSLMLFPTDSSILSNLSHSSTLILTGVIHPCFLAAWTIVSPLALHFHSKLQPLYRTPLNFQSHSRFFKCPSFESKSKKEYSYWHQISMFLSCRHAIWDTGVMDHYFLLLILFRLPNHVDFYNFSFGIVFTPQQKIF